MTSMPNEKILITKIQRFSLHDGPGIRTTIFLKGCSLHCPWCCNPENISHEIEPYWRNGIEGKWGNWYSQEELYNEVIKDKGYYIGELGKEDYFIKDKKDIARLPGGVTFSGGEALLQIKAYKDLLERLGGEGVHRTIETSLFASKEQVRIAIESFDLFYVDIKLLEADKCRKTLGGDKKLYIDNLDYLIRSEKPIIFRVPVIREYTDSEENIDRIMQLILKIKSINILKIELLKGHRLGEQKYLDLKKEVPKMKDISDEELLFINKMISSTGVHTEIHKI